MSVTNYGSTYSSSGKLGGCYTGDPTQKQYLKADYNDGTTNSVANFMSKYINKHSFSLAAWSNTDANGSMITITYGVRLTNGSFLLGNSSQSVSVGSRITDGKWHHYCGTYDVDTGIMTMYVDGVQTATKTFANYASSWNNALIGIGRDWNASTATASFFMNKGINDVRVYDHCLSPKEVKELSKGLILHYKLDDAYCESTTNKFAYPEPYTTYSYSYATNPIGVKNWSNGYNSGVTNPSEGTHAYWRLVDDIPTMIFPDTNSSVGQVHRWLGIFTTNLKKEDFTAGTTYTVSFDAKADVAGKIVQVGFYYKKSGATSNGFYDGTKSFTITTEWERYSATFTCASGVSDGTSYYYFYGNYGTEGTSYIRNAQLEIKSHATPYTKISRTSTVIYDSSGYDNNGIINGNISCSDDTPRNEKSTYVSSGNYIQTNMPLPNRCEEFTFSFWGQLLDLDTAKANLWTTHSNYSKGLVNSGGNGSVYAYNGGGLVTSCRYYNSTDGTACVYSGFGTGYRNTDWHMYTISADSSGCNTYLDGVFYTTRSLSDFASFNTYSPIKLGYTEEINISDYRVYATALSATDIKELYDTSAVIDSGNNDFSYKFKESGTNPIITKTGLTTVANFSEIKDYFDKTYIETLGSTVVWDNDNSVTVTTKTGQTYSGIKLKNTSASPFIFPYGTRYIMEFDILVPSTHTLQVDMNNTPISGSAWNGNDNDTNRGTQSRSISGGVSTHVRVTGKNSNALNTEHIPLLAWDFYGINTKNDTEVITYTIKNMRFTVCDSNEECSYGTDYINANQLIEI